MTRSTMKKLDTYAFVGVLAALLSFLVWFVTTHL